MCQQRPGMPRATALTGLLKGAWLLPSNDITLSNFTHSPIPTTFLTWKQLVCWQRPGVLWECPVPQR